MSEKRLILGTAGHIDHGKTALVKSLTGVDTDRLQEEKARGITIDLGFAELVPREGLRLGIVDVPGHEGFIRNMLAGATGMDLVLMVVAADEGMMPQTREHLEIVRLLGVDQMVVALTKSDLVEEEWLSLVEEEVAEVLSGTPFAGAPMVRTSTVTGEGRDELVEALGRAAEGMGERSSADIARLPIDRAFTVKGTGTVVTGTLWSGSLSMGDSVVLQPSGIDGRVRGLQVHGVQVERAEAGERTAVALTGSDIDLETVERGQVLVLDADWPPTSMLTVALTVLPDTGWTVKHGQRVRVHLGTSEVMARVVTLEGNEVPPGGSGWVQLRLEKPLLARARDRLVVRSYSPVTTIGGGTVAEPVAPKRKRLRDGESEALGEIVHGEGPSFLEALLALSGWRGVRNSQISVVTGLAPGVASSATALLLKSGARDAYGEVFGSAVVESARTVLEEAVANFHQEEPLRPGIGIELLRQRLPTRDEARLADLLLDEGVESGRIAVREGLASLPGYEPSLDAGQEALRNQLIDIYRQAGLAPPAAGDLPEGLSGNPDLWPILKLLERGGHLVNLDDNFFANSQVINEAMDKVKNELTGAKALVPADFRAVLSVTRKYLIPILSYFDRVGLTIRQGDGRDVLA
jgi:selenocysteine-specific elongation factor